MEGREDLKSILPFLPLILRSSNLFWPSQVVDVLKLIARGPHHSHVDSGRALARSISDLTNCLSPSSKFSASSAPHGYELFFDELLSRIDANKWFDEVVPAMANLLLQLPSMLESHYETAHLLLSDGRGRVKVGLRLLGSQEAGMVFLSQELIGAILACAFFCLFPVTTRRSNDLPTINFENLFAILYDNYSQSQENKIRCIIHYFRRISDKMPSGFVSFERKVLNFQYGPQSVSYPKADFWSYSMTPLCHFEVNDSCRIEDQSSGALEVDFANKYIGGGALRSGCVQEEIRFMINPELIAGMLFLPSMADNEAVEIVGVERFSYYTGYASTFRFAGDYIDRNEVDLFGRRKTRIIAIDALCNPRMRQYRPEFLLREINKAFCGFFDQYKSQQYARLFQESGCCRAKSKQEVSDLNDTSGNDILLCESSSGAVQYDEGKHCQDLDNEGDAGIVTGNWGCGAFGGDPELKSIIQWLAASQALRPSISYYTFGIDAMQNLEQVSKWVVSHEWTVGDLWKMLVEYSTQRYNGGGTTNVGFFAWLLPSLVSTTCRD